MSCSGEVGKWMMMYVCYFAGESVDDCGGGYSESIAEMCDELQNCDSLLPLLIATPNGRDEAGTSRDDKDDIEAADYSALYLLEL